MNSERPDEVDAKQIIERVLGVELEHADKFGGVDYRSTDGRIAVEVTRVTEGLKRSSRNALRKSRDAGAPESQLRTCWRVQIPETKRRLDTFYQNVQPALVALELAGEASFERHSAVVHVRQQGPLSLIYQPLVLAGVERASAMPKHEHEGDSESHHLIPTHVSGGSSSGSDRAVTLLVDALGEKTDNPKKLAASGAEQRHLFVWLDSNTAFNITRPLDHDAPSWDVERFGVPSSAPVLYPAITHLWVMREGNGRGWLWDGETWRELRDPGHR